MDTFEKRAQEAKESQNSFSASGGEMRGMVRTRGDEDIQTNQGQNSSLNKSGYTGGVLGSCGTVWRD